MRPFGYPVTILNTIDHLGKFNGKADKGFFVRYPLNSKTFRVFNSRTRIVEENLHIRFSENTPNVEGNGPDWLFDTDALTRTMNYEPIVAGTQSNGFTGTKVSDNVPQASKETEPVKNYILLPLWTVDLPYVGILDLMRQTNKRMKQERLKGKGPKSTIRDSLSCIICKTILDELKRFSTPYSQDPKSSYDDGSKPSSDDGKKVDEDPRKESEYDEDDGAEADMNNLDTTIQVSPILTTRIHKDHPLDEVIGDLQSSTQTRNMLNNLEQHGFVSTIQQRTYHKDLQNCLFASFLSQEEPKKIIHALKDPSWIEAMQEELLQFKNKKDERGIVITNKARLVAQGYTQKEWIDYDEVFALVARIEAIRLFLAYASFKDFVVYQMDVKMFFSIGRLKKRCMYVNYQDLKIQTFLIEYTRLKKHCMDYIKLLEPVNQKEDDIFISQDKYVAEILKKFGFIDVKTTSTPMETQKPLLKDENGEEVDVHMYRSMISSLVYLTSSRPDIMFAVCACARYQVNPKVSHLYVVKRIFRYLKGQPKLVLWYPKDSPFDLVEYTDSDYAGASLDRKSSTRGCQFLRCRLISWQCKKQTVVSNSTTVAEYVAASSCYGQVLWIQNQLLDYGYALTVNPTIYVSCIEQFWSTAVAKTINGEVQLHARVDGKEIVIFESTVRRDL
ncbi:putative ribonuclease H-like domain-containing protein [Tanacetum coccineum]